MEHKVFVDCLRRRELKVLSIEFLAIEKVDLSYFGQCCKEIKGETRHADVNQGANDNQLHCSNHIPEVTDRRSEEELHRQTACWKQCEGIEDNVRGRFYNIESDLVNLRRNYLCNLDDVVFEHSDIQRLQSFFASEDLRCVDCDLEKVMKNMVWNPVFVRKIKSYFEKGWGLLSDWKVKREVLRLIKPPLT